MILFYVVRHGETDISPAPEWHSQVALNGVGRAQANAAGCWIAANIEPSKQPKWGVASDLKRAEQTLAIVANVLQIPRMRPIPGLRAVDKGEDQKGFEIRNQKAFEAIVASRKASGKIPLVACHRSNTAYLAKAYGGVIQPIDYREHSAVNEGGIIEVSTDRGLTVLYRPTDENPRANFEAKDGTAVSGFVTEEVNHLPRQCSACRWMDKDHCDNPVVTADDELNLYYGRKRNKSGKWLVMPKDCCDHFQHKLKEIGGGA